MRSPGVQRYVAEHAEDTRDPRPHPLAQARRALRTGYEVSQQRLLTEAETRSVRFKKNNEPIVNLEQALVLCRQLHLGVMLDLKDSPRTEMLQRIAALVRKHGLAKAA